MGSVFRNINAPVGTRNGVTPMPNQPRDLATITDLFDRIPVRNGGSAEIGGVWAMDRAALIAEVTAQIVTFQTVNNRPVIDGVIDPGGGTLKLMNQLSSDGPAAALTAAVVDAPEGYGEEQGPVDVYGADVSMMAGIKPFGWTALKADYIRKLVYVDSGSINWFGVVCARGSFGSVPHINFTPTPIQGGYPDTTYGSFGGWGRLWADYTSVIGGQMVAAGVDQILVIPFYRTSQSGKLGDFLANWKEVVSAVITAAINSIDPYYLRDTYSFDHICSSSFSNGWVAHQNFYSHATGAASMTDVLFDLDGQAGGSHWRPPEGIIYQNRGAPGSNPIGNVWYVGGRWGASYSTLYGGTLNSHAACRNHLLYHGLWLCC